LLATAKIHFVATHNDGYFIVNFCYTREPESSEPFCDIEIVDIINQNNHIAFFNFLVSLGFSWFLSAGIYQDGVVLIRKKIKIWWYCHRLEYFGDFFWESVCDDCCDYRRLSDTLYTQINQWKSQLPSPRNNTLISLLLRWLLSAIY